MENVQRAIQLAVKWHADQYRNEHKQIGSKVPFIVHPMEVMKLVYDWGGGTPDNLSAAICHDILEDTKVPLSELYLAIGEKALVYVQHLTNPEVPGLSKGEKAIRKNNYLHSFRTKPIDVFIIKLADRCCNVHDFANCGDKHYAAIYREKANILFYLLNERNSEISKLYGRGTTAKMRASVDELFAY